MSLCCTQNSAIFRRSLCQDSGPRLSDTCHQNLKDTWSNLDKPNAQQGGNSSHIAQDVRLVPTHGLEPAPRQLGRRSEEAQVTPPLIKCRTLREHSSSQ